MLTTKKTTGTVLNVNNAANVRSGPSSSYETIWTLAKYETFEVISETGSYYEIVWGNKTGYMSQSLGVLDEDSYEGSIGGVDAVADVRSAPGEEYIVIEEVLKDETVEILGVFEECTKVRLIKGRYGYVNTSYIGKNIVTTTGNIISNLKVKSAANVRKEASSSSEVIATITKGESVDITGVNGNYFMILLSDGESGYVSKSLVATIGEVTASVNLREGPGTEYKVIEVLKVGTEVEVISDTGWYYQINTQDGTAYVSNSYVTLQGSIPTGYEASEENIVDKLLEEARKYIGVPYLYGGTTTSGFDCSGFTQYVFAAVGMTLNRTAAQQMKHGVLVVKKDLTAGDLVFFNPLGTSYATHVGIYTGDGNMIHASSSKGIIESSMEIDYWAGCYLSSRRIF